MSALLATVQTVAYRGIVSASLDVAMPVRRHRATAPPAGAADGQGAYCARREQRKGLR